MNAYLVWDPETRLAAVFDTGADAMPLVEEIKKHKLTLQDVYLTHTHVDHVMELDRLLEKAGGSVGVHVNEAEALDKRPHSSRALPFRSASCASSRAIPRDTRPAVRLFIFTGSTGHWR